MFCAGTLSMDCVPFEKVPDLHWVPLAHWPSASELISRSSVSRTRCYFGRFRHRILKSSFGSLCTPGETCRTTTTSNTEMETERYRALQHFRTQAPVFKRVAHPS